MMSARRWSQPAAGSLFCRRYSSARFVSVAARRMSPGPKPSASFRAASHIFSASAYCPFSNDSPPAAMYFSQRLSSARSGAARTTSHASTNARCAIIDPPPTPGGSLTSPPAPGVSLTPPPTPGGSLPCQPEARARPPGRDQPACPGERDEGGPEIRPAEADVRRDRVARGHVLDRAAVGGDHADAAVHQRRDADVAGAVDGERVEALEAGEPGQERAAARAEAHRHDDLTRRADLPRPHPPRPRLRDVEPLPVGREPDAVRPVEREDDLLDERPVGARVEDAGAISVAPAQLAVVGEPEAAAVSKTRSFGPRSGRPSHAV